MKTQIPTPTEIATALAYLALIPVQTIQTDTLCVIAIMLAWAVLRPKK